ncbi:MAG: DUF4011 domain-containing protein, partial [Chloroflexi bacterium]|nr:DUF4011 domain-containing protein [Chloroflexota bacterium]
DRIALAADALAGNAVHTTLAPEDLEARVLDLYRTVRTTMEETGANNLYLAIGFVSWTPKPTEARGAIRAGTYRAPLLLVPVALERKGVRSGFTLRRHDEPATINPTLLEMLRQDFRVQIPELDGDLPVDANGIDVRGIWTMVRTYLNDLAGFEVTEEVARGGDRGAQFRAVRPSRDGQEPDDLEPDRAPAFSGEDGAVRVAEGDRFGGGASAIGKGRSRTILP